MARTRAEWIALARSVAQGTFEAQDPAPQPACCGTVCATVNSSTVVRYAEHLLLRFQGWLRSLKKPQVLLRTEVREGDVALVQRFDFVASWLPATGNVPFRCNLLQCANVARGMPCDDTELVLRRSERAVLNLLDQRASAAFEAPFQGEHCLGAFEQQSEKEWIAELLQGTLLEPGLSVWACDHTEVGFARFRVSTCAAGSDLHVTVATMCAARSGSGGGGNTRNSLK